MLWRNRTAPANVRSSMVDVNRRFWLQKHGRQPVVPYLGDEETNKLRGIFAAFDGDSDGIVSMDEIRTVSRRFNLSGKGIFEILDFDGDGELTFTEFQHALRGTTIQEEDMKQFMIVGRGKPRDRY